MGDVERMEMDEIEIINAIKLERAEFISRLMIDAELTENDVKIGLCLLHESLLDIIKEAPVLKSSGVRQEENRGTGYC